MTGMAHLVSRLLFVTLGILLLSIISYKIVSPGDDPYRCRALLERGTWIDPPHENGTRLPFHNWQPEGCMLHHYSSSEIRQCMDGRHIIFSGDSTTRQIVYGMARLLEREEANFDRKSLPLHVSFNLTYHGIQLQQFWNPFLESTDHPSQGLLVKQLKLIGDERAHPVSIKDQKGAAIAIFGVGAWFSNMQAEQGQMLDNYTAALSNVSDILGSQQDLFSKSMDPIDGVGNQAFFAPPSGPWYSSTERRESKDKSHHRTVAMQNFLNQTRDGWNFWLAWSVPGLVEEGLNDTIVDPKGTGWHVIDSVAETKANILLNLRCNAKLDRLKGYPYTRTCCTDYGSKTLVQSALVAVGHVLLAACLACETWDLATSRTSSRCLLLTMEMGSFVMALLMCYYADRTQMLAKGAKLFLYSDFALLSTLCIAIALITIRKSQPPQPGALTVVSDQAFLSRDQTEEWKGWMQFVILIYHWTGSKSLGIYVFIRLLVAAYLFQTGYGHTRFFLIKKDFSFKRMSSVLLRLNLLSCSLAYFMNTNWMFYYFSPLVSFWFLIVYATMAINHTNLNGNTQLVLAKIGTSAILVAVAILLTPLTSWMFAILHAIFRIQWNLHEWEYWVGLDLFIVYMGMFVAVAQHKVKEELSFALRCGMAVAGFVVMCGYAFTCTTKFSSKADYLLWHPYISFAPILAYIILRNVSSSTRHYHSKAMSWLGRCSLETYTLQFHILLAADTQGVLVIDGFTGDASLADRWRSLIIIVPIFLWISSMTARATGNLVQSILVTSPSSKEVSIQNHSTGDAVTDDPSTTYSDAETGTLGTNPVPDPFEKRATSMDSPINDREITGVGEAIPLHDVDFRDDVVISDSEPLLIEQGSPVPDHPRSAITRHMKQFPLARFIFNSPQARIVLFLLAMWLLNLLSPLPPHTPIPDGFTPHRVNISSIN